MLNKLFKFNDYKFFILFSCFFISSCSLIGIENSSDYYRVGVISSLSIEFVSGGESMLDIYNLSFNEINDAGGINGKKVRLFVADGMCSRKGGKLAAEKLIFEDRVDLIIGGACSSAALGAVEVTDENNVIFMSSYSSSHLLSDSSDLFFRNIFSNAHLSKKLAEEIFFSGVYEVALITEFSDYTDSLRDIFIIEYAKLGGSVIYQDSFDTFDLNYNYFFSILKSKNISTLLFFFSNPFVGKSFISNLEGDKDLSLNLYFNDLFVNDLLVREFSPFLNGSKAVSIYVDDEDKRVKVILKKLDDFIGFDLTYSISLPLIISSYELPYIISQVAEYNLCDLADFECMQNGLYYMENFDSIYGDLNFDLNGDIDVVPVIFVVDEDVLSLVE